ncbi:MAG: flavin reductase family protein [Segniliparus sp.]|uniref:flavin reductase family protein n=1 Tax=Segniliparus sp. TaxID=2804064 RepID=UPI003F311523
MRTVLLPKDDNPAYFYGVLTASVVPRPIAWVSSRSAAGTPNLAPYSFFTVVSGMPPVVLFSSNGEKDSLRNIRETKQFVINLAAEPLFEKINATSAPFDAEVSEFEAVGLTDEPSERVDVPRVSQSPLAIECSLREIIPVEGSFLVLGDVLCVSADPDVLAEDGLPSFPDLAPLTRLGRTEWSFPGEVRAIDRPAAP